MRALPLATVLLGVAMAAAGPAVAALGRAAPHWSVLVDVGQSGPGPRVLPQQVVAGLQPPLRGRVVSSHVVEVTGPVDQRAQVEAAANALARPAAPRLTCPLEQPGCAAARLEAAPLYNSATRALDPAALDVPPLPRLVWLAGMAVFMLGVALAGVGMVRLAPHLSARRWVLLTALAGGICGGVAGMQLGVALTQTLVITAAQRPRLASEAITRDLYQASHDVAARVASAGFRAPLEVEVHAVGLGPAVLVSMRAPGPGQLAAFTARVQDGVVAWDVSQNQATRQELTALAAAPDPAVAAQALVMLVGLVEPELVVGRVEPDGRSPGVTALAGALAGALLAWAARARVRTR